MTTHARDVTSLFLIAAAIMAAAVYGYATLRQNAILPRREKLPPSEAVLPGEYRPYSSASCGFLTLPRARRLPTTRTR